MVIAIGCIVIFLIILLEAIGLGIDLILALVPILIARKTADFQWRFDWKVLGVITYIVGISATVVMFADFFMRDVYFGLKPLIITGIYCGVTALIEIFWSN